MFINRCISQKSLIYTNLINEIAEQKSAGVVKVKSSIKNIKIRNYLSSTKK